MYAYPATLPSDEITFLIGEVPAVFSGGAINKSKTVQAAWSLSGYALSQMVPTAMAAAAPCPCPTPGPCPCPTPDEGKKILEDLSDHIKGKKVGLVIPWASLIAFAFSILQQILGGIIPKPAP